ncbi:MAG: ABC transporter substrate-binding protein [Caulobacteraceae bacterium]
MPAYVRVHTSLATVYLIFNTRDVPALRQVGVRQALSMAVDRDFITGKLLRSGQVPAYAFVPPGIADYKPGAHAYWAGWSLARRQAEARRLLAQAGYGPGHPLSFELKLPNTNDAGLMTAAIQADWKTIGVKASLIQNEGQIAFQAYNDRDFQVGVASWIADYNDPMTFLALLQSQTGAQNYGDYRNPAYDRLLAMADQERDVAKRADDLAKAEQIMLDDAALGPVYFAVTRELVNPKITGWVPNVLDIHRARYLCETKR